METGYIKRDIPNDIQIDDTTVFVPPIDEGRVIKVYDGDTITVAAFLPYPESPLYRFSVRLNGIDTPEMRTDDENEKQVAYEAQQALEKLILGKTVTLMNTGSDKYGRVLATVYVDDLNVCQWMLDNHFAVAYAGGTKETPDDWIAYRKKAL